MRPANEFAETILDLANRTAPSRYKEIVRAMRNELETLEQGRVSWALGCLRAVLGLRLADAWPFYLVVLLVGIAFDFARSVPLLLLHGSASPTLLYLYWLSTPALLCTALAAWKPERAYGGAIGLFALQIVISMFELAFSLRASVLPDQVLGASPIVGWSAQLGWCLAGAWFGRVLSKKLPDYEAERRARLEKRV